MENELASATAEWAMAKGFEPWSLWTLTFDPARRSNLNRSVALWWWRRLVEALNENAALSKDYRRKWGHSYFSYFVGVELHKSGDPHLHAVVDRWVDFEFIIRWWKFHCGRLDLKTITSGPGALRYVLKYISKDDGAHTFWFQKRDWKISRVDLRQFDCGPSTLCVERPVATAEAAKPGTLVKPAPLLPGFSADTGRRLARPVGVGLTRVGSR